MQRWNPDVRADGSSDNSISILDPIGANWFGEGVTAKRIAGALRAIGDGEVIVNINSPGGDFFEGLAIYNLLAEHPGKVTVKILGLAASAAAVIAMAGDEILIAQAGFLMIHNTWVVAAGDRHALADVAEWLQPFDEVSADVFHARSGVDRASIVTMLDRETWISGSSAVDQGFADDVLSSDQVKTDPENRNRISSTAAERKMALHLKRSGVSRSEGRRLVAALKGGMPLDAAPTGKPDDAAVNEGLKRLLSKMQST